MRDWTKFDKSTIIQLHGDMYRFRELYKGRHAKLFPRAIDMIANGEIVDDLIYGNNSRGQNIKTPYVVFNICRIIVDVPTLMINRSLGQVKTNFPAEKELTEATTDEQAEMIEGVNDDSFNGEVIDLQQETIDQITKNSRLNHAMNISQWQIDGGIVSVPAVVNGQIKIQVKERNIYFPHDDEQGYDLIYELSQTEEEKKELIDYVHVYTERELEDRLATIHRLYKRSGEGRLTQIEDFNFIKERLGIEEIYQEFIGRKRSFIAYLPFMPSFIDPLGVSVLDGQENKQEEVNWTVTRSAQTFERNGKPRISFSRDTMETLRNRAYDKFGDDTKIDHRWFEVLEMDADGRSIEIHQIDIDKIGDMGYVKEVIRAMLAETQTSESALELVRQESSAPQSGVAKFYDLIVSVMKAEQMRGDYIQWLQESYENALWLANKENPNVLIERPIVMTSEMIPTPRKEVEDNNNSNFERGTQSLYETVKRNNPDKSEEWINKELERIGEGATSQDSMSLLNGNMNLTNFLDNKTPEGQPLNEDGTPVEPQTTDEIK